MKGLLRSAVPAGLLGTLCRPGASRRRRVLAAGALLSYWSVVYARYRRWGLERTRHEYDLLAGVDREAFRRHYDERVPTVEEEFELWGPYHTHRHRMRYDIVAGAVRRHLPDGGRILDVGCGAALVADRISDLRAHYVGFDFGGPHIGYARRKYAGHEGSLEVSLAQSDAERMPFGDGTFDVVVMSEVIEHLVRPDRAVWEVSRILRPGGVFLMTTNNASEMPLRSPLSHLLPWLEKSLGATRPALISRRPWIWPEKVDPDLLPPDSPDVYLPHTHHIPAETRRLFALAGLETFRWSTFEFPPPQSATAGRLEAMGERGLRLVDALERWACAMPGIRRLGTHLFMQARKDGAPVSPVPPPGAWPGPRSS